MGRLRVGVLGCAAIARRNTIPALAADPRIDLVAVASRTAGRAADFAAQFGCAAVTGYDRLLERTDLDAVYVPLPPALHAEWIAKALSSGRHVLAEKPLATSAAQARELVTLADRHGLALLENFAFLRHRQHAEVRALLAGGVIGDLRALTVDFGFPPLAAGDIRYQPELGGGALLDAGVYGLRATSLFLGPGVRVLGAGLRTDPGSGVDVGGSALLSNPDGVTSVVSFGFDRSYRCSYTLWGSAGRMVLERAFTPPPAHRCVLRIERQDVPEERLLPADHQFARVVSAFADVAIDGPGPDRPGDCPGAGRTGGLQGPAEEIVRQAELVDAVRSAALAAPRV